MQELRAASAPELRLHLFDAVNTRAGGFVDGDARTSLLGDVGAGLGCDAAQLELLLWSDSEQRERLTQVDPLPDPETLAAQYNRRALETLLYRTLSADLFLPAPNGAAIRRVYFAVKRAGLLCELSLQDVEQGAGAGVWVHLFGPLEVFGPRTRHGERFAQAVLELLRTFGTLEGSARVLINEREYVLRLSRGVLNGGPARAVSEVGGPAPAFDSGVERQLFETLRGMERRDDSYGWTVEREPEPIVNGPTVLVPDFALTRAGDRDGGRATSKRVFVEVIGFWTQEYRERKRAKLQALSGTVDLVLVVQEALAPYFGELPYAVLPYARRPSAHDLVTLLERTYPAARPRRARRATKDDGQVRAEWESLFGAAPPPK